MSKKFRNALVNAATMTEKGRKEGYALLIEYQEFLRAVARDKA